MAADFNKPTITGDAYVDVLGEIRAQFEVVSTMSYGDALNTNVGAVQFLDGSLQKWSGSSFDVVPVSITGGGTGASTAAGARTALNVNEKGTLAAQVRSNAESDALYVPQSRTITTAGALNGGNSLDSNISLTIDSATTSQQGVVQLFNGLNSTSTTQALTAAQGKVLKDTQTSNYSDFSTYINNRESFKIDYLGGTSVNSTPQNIKGPGDIVGAITRLSAGRYRCTFSTGLSSADYNVVTTVLDSSSLFSSVASLGTSSFEVNVFNASGVATDSDVFVYIETNKYT